MRHVPHVFVQGPWGDDVLRLPEASRHHLEQVLRRDEGSPVSYTDGAGRLGRGSYERGLIRRGEESIQPADTIVRVALAPPRTADRVRFAVEKLGELGVAELVWLRTARGEGRAPKPDKARAWAVAALQQSRGAHLMEILGPRMPADVVGGDRVLVAAPGGVRLAAAIDPGDAVTIVIGPEGGFAPDEIPGDAVCVGLGARILRTETAAVLAAGLAFEALRTDV